MAEKRSPAGAANYFLWVFGLLTCLLLPGAFPFRPALTSQRRAAGRRMWTVEHAAHLFRHDLSPDLGDTGAIGDAAPFGILSGRV